MSEQKMQIRRVVAEGRVQGVGYRDFVRRAARRLEVSGWVRNRSDGTVEAMLAGRPDDVAALIEQMRRGPSWGLLASLRVSDPGEAADVAPGVFSVRATI